MKPSEITEATVKTFLRDPEAENTDIMLAAARSFVQNYTGLTSLEADRFEDITIAILCLVGDMYDNRTFTVENDKLNPAAKMILDMHSVNLI